MDDYFPADMKNDIMDDILTTRNEDGFTLMYHDPSRPRLGRCCTCNLRSSGN